jgi:hypothetical protein
MSHQPSDCRCLDCVSEVRHRADRAQAQTLQLHELLDRQRTTLRQAQRLIGECIAETAIHIGGDGEGEIAPGNGVMNPDQEDAMKPGRRIKLRRDVQTTLGSFSKDSLGTVQNVEHGWLFVRFDESKYIVPIQLGEAEAA